MAKRRSKAERAAAAFRGRLARAALFHKRSAASYKGKLTRLKKLLAQRPRGEGEEIPRVVLYAASPGTAAPGFQPLDQWPADGVLRFSVEWRSPGDMARVIESEVLEMPLPVELATVGSVFRNRLRALLDEWKGDHPELDEESPALIVTRLVVEPD